jgi:hypothetical protein
LKSFTLKTGCLDPSLEEVADEPADDKAQLLSVLMENGYFSAAVLKEEDPEVLMGLQEVQALKPGHKLVLKKAFVDLRKQ